MIFAIANAFSQLNLVFTAKSLTGFRSGILWKYEFKVRGSHWSCSVKVGVLKYFANFTGKHLCWSLFLTEPSGLKLFKKVSPDRCFLLGFAKILRTPILKKICEHCFWNLFRFHQGCPFLVTYTSGSNWYICFNFVS